MCNFVYCTNFIQINYNMRILQYSDMPYNMTLISVPDQKRGDHIILED